jgi:hypothetical protein
MSELHVLWVSTALTCESQLKHHNIPDSMLHVNGIEQAGNLLPQDIATTLLSQYAQIKRIYCGRSAAEIETATLLYKALDTVSQKFKNDFENAKEQRDKLSSNYKNKHVEYKNFFLDLLKNGRATLTDLSELNKSYDNIQRAIEDDKKLIKMSYPLVHEKEIHIIELEKQRYTRLNDVSLHFLNNQSNPSFKFEEGVDLKNTWKRIDLINEVNKLLNKIKRIKQLLN